MFERMEELLDFEKPDLVRTIPGNLFPEYRAELPRVGFFGEPVCDPQLNSGLFNAMLECGDVMGVFCGHDHNNDYAINNRGILLAYGRYSGGDTVYNDIPNGTQGGKPSFYYLGDSKGWRENRLLGILMNSGYICSHYGKICM